MSPALPVIRPASLAETPLKPINAPLVADWLVRFIREEMVRRRGIERAVIGLSGGVDSGRLDLSGRPRTRPAERVRVPDALQDLDPSQPGPRSMGG